MYLLVDKRQGVGNWKYEVVSKKDLEDRVKELINDSLFKLDIGIDYKLNAIKNKSTSDLDDLCEIVRYAGYDVYKPYGM